jgi:pimeloyl-ACP methyl ester carboxylesterase
MHSRRKLPGEDQWGDLYPFASHYLDIDGSRLHYIDEGSGEESATLLFVHGNPTWSFYWRRMILACRGQYRCVAPDHLGCGLSDLQPRPLRLADHIDNLVQLIETLDLRRVTLVAQDWGGAIGLGAVMRTRPSALSSGPKGKRFERLILTNTGAFQPWFIPWRIRVCRLPVVGQLAVQGANAFSRAALRMTLARTNPLPEQVATAYLAPYANWAERAAVYQFVRDIPLSASHPTWQTLGEIEAGLPSLAELPTLLLWGMRDWCFTPECLERFQHYWPAAEVMRLEDVGHWVLEDAPEDAEAAITEFLARTARPMAGVVQ